jgi:hypothetical protein
MMVLKLLLPAIVMNLIIHISWGNLHLLQNKVDLLAMVANVDNTSKLWHQCLGHTNFGTLCHMSCLRMADGLPQIEPPVVSMKDVCWENTIMSPFLRI